LKRDGVPIDNIRDEQLRDLFGFLDSGETTKEAIPDVLTWLSRHEGTNVKEAIEGLGLTMLSQKDLVSIVDDLVMKNKVLVEKRGMAAFGVLMGIIMQRVRGRADAERVSETLKKHLAEVVD
jgi:Glu-tRNA(Gln) amidotransferase subunit E-like FAD-binding protein